MNLSRWFARKPRDRMAELFDLVPPGRITTNHGKQAFFELGRKWAATMNATCHLRPDDRVLDIGCGPGRMAIGLSRYLGHGSLEGFDVDASAIAWARKNISPLWPKARFRHVDLNNDHYHRAGTLQASTFAFPFDESEFDFAFATSVFTHLVDDDATNYLRETFRVLKPGASFFTTWFLLTTESRQRMSQGRNRFTFAHELGAFSFSEAKDRPLDAVAFDWPRIEVLIREVGFDVSMRIPGRWSDSAAADKHSQDIVVLRKPVSFS